MSLFIGVPVSVSMLVDMHHLNLGFHIISSITYVTDYRSSSLCKHASVYAPPEPRSAVKAHPLYIHTKFI
jgi:hypothetical protein